MEIEGFKVVDADDVGPVHRNGGGTWEPLRDAIRSLRHPNENGGRIKWVEVPVPQGRTPRGFFKNLSVSLRQGTSPMPKITLALRGDKIYVRPVWPGIDTPLSDSTQGD